AGSENPEPLPLIRPVPDRFPPIPVRQIPVHRLGQPGLEALHRFPAQLGLDLRRIDRIAAIMPGPIGNEADQIAVTPSPDARIEQIADRLDYLEVGPLLPPADQIGLAGPAPS